MRGLGKLAWVEAKLFLREPAAAFFTLAFPPMLLLLFGSIYGNEPSPFLGGLGYVDVSVPAFTAMVIASTGLIALPLTVAAYRERKVLRRLQATPLRPQALLIALVSVLLLMTALGLALLIATGKLLYGLRFSGNPASVLGAFLLGSLSFFALGFVLAGLAPTVRTTQVVAFVLFYPMIFLSGAAIPHEIFPETLRQAAQALPLTHVVTLLRGLWVGEGWGAHLLEVGLLTGLILVGTALSARTFRWE